MQNETLKANLIRKEKKKLRINDSMENNERNTFILVIFKKNFKSIQRFVKQDLKCQNIMEKEDYYKKRLEMEKLKLELQKQTKLYCFSYEVYKI